jgi:hypothetical protein
MLTAVHVEIDKEDPEHLFVRFFGSGGESDFRAFWIQGLTLLPEMARICLERQVDQMLDGKRDRG